MGSVSLKIGNGTARFRTDSLCSSARIRMESANHFYIWLSRLDELPRRAQEARVQMKVPCEIIRVPQTGHFSFIDDSAFHKAVFYACRRFLVPDPDNDSLPLGLTSA